MSEYRESAITGSNIGAPPQNAGGRVVKPSAQPRQMNGGSSSAPRRKPPPAQGRRKPSARGRGFGGKATGVPPSQGQEHPPYNAPFGRGVNSAVVFEHNLRLGANWRAAIVALWCGSELAHNTDYDIIRARERPPSRPPPKGHSREIVVRGSRALPAPDA